MSRLGIRSFVRRIAIAGVVCCNAAYSGDSEWIAETSTDFFNPSRFEYSANWKNGIVATNDAAYAYFTNTLANPSGIHYVTIPDDWRLKRLVSDHKYTGNKTTIQTHFISDRSMRIDEFRGY